MLSVVFPGVPIARWDCPFSVITNDLRNQRIIRIVREYLSHLNDLYLEIALRDLKFTSESSVFLSPFSSSRQRRIKWEDENSRIQCPVSPYASVLKYPFFITIVAPTEGAVASAAGAAAPIGGAAAPTGGVIFRCDMKAQKTFSSARTLDPSSLYANHHFFVVKTVKNETHEVDGLFVYNLESDDSFHLPFTGLREFRFINTDQLTVLFFENNQNNLDVWNLSTKECIHSVVSDLDLGVPGLNSNQAYLRLDSLVVPSSGQEDYVYSVVPPYEPRLAPAMHGACRDTVFTIAEEPGAALLGFRSTQNRTSNRFQPVLQFGKWEKRFSPITLLQGFESLTNQRDTFGISLFMGLFRTHLVFAFQDQLVSIDLAEHAQAPQQLPFAAWGNFLGVDKPRFSHDPPAFVFNTDGDRMFMCTYTGQSRFLKAATIEE